MAKVQKNRALVTAYPEQAGMYTNLAKKAEREAAEYAKLTIRQTAVIEEAERVAKEERGLPGLRGGLAGVFHLAPGEVEHVVSLMFPPKKWSLYSPIENTLLELECTEKISKSTGIKIVYSIMGQTLTHARHPDRITEVFTRTMQSKREKDPDNGYLRALLDQMNRKDVPSIFEKTAKDAVAQAREEVAREAEEKVGGAAVAAAPSRTAEAAALHTDVKTQTDKMTPAAAAELAPLLRKRDKAEKAAESAGSEFDRLGIRLEAILKAGQEETPDAKITQAAKNAAYKEINRRYKVLDEAYAAVSRSESKNMGYQQSQMMNRKNKNI